MLSVYECLLLHHSSVREEEHCRTLTLSGFPEESMLADALQCFMKEEEQQAPKPWWIFDFSHLSLLDWRSFQLLGKTLSCRVEHCPPVNGLIFVLPENPFVRVWLEEVLQEVEEELPVYYVYSCQEARQLVKKVL